MKDSFPILLHRTLFFKKTTLPACCLASIFQPWQCRVPITLLSLLLPTMRMWRSYVSDAPLGCKLSPTQILAGMSSHSVTIDSDSSSSITARRQRKMRLEAILASNKFLDNMPPSATTHYCFQMPYFGNPQRIARKFRNCTITEIRSF